MARQAASVPESLRGTARAGVQASRCVSGLQYGEFLGSVFASAVLRLCLADEMKPGLRRVQRVSSTRFWTDKRRFEIRAKFLVCLPTGLGLSPRCVEQLSIIIRGQRSKHTIF